MENAIFTISRGTAGRVNVKSKRFNTYNRNEVPEAQLFQTLEELADIFNNVLKIGIEFAVE